MKKGFFTANFAILSNLVSLTPELTGEERSTRDDYDNSNNNNDNSDSTFCIKSPEYRASLTNLCAVDISPTTTYSDRALNMIKQKIAQLLCEISKMAEIKGSLESVFGLNNYTSANVSKNNARATWKLRCEGVSEEWSTCSLKNECDMFVFVMGCLCMGMCVKLINMKEGSESQRSRVIQWALNCFEWSEYSAPSMHQQEYYPTGPFYLQRNICAFMKEYCLYINELMKINRIEPENRREMLVSFTKAVHILRRAQKEYETIGNVYVSPLARLYECMEEDLKVTETWRCVYYCMDLLFSNKCQRYEEEYRCMIILEDSARNAVTPKIKSEIQSIISKINAEYTFKTSAAYSYMRNATYYTKQYIYGSSDSSGQPTIFTGLDITKNPIQSSGSSNGEKDLSHKHIMFVKELMQINLILQNTENNVNRDDDDDDDDD